MVPSLRVPLPVIRYGNRDVGLEGKPKWNLVGNDFYHRNMRRAETIVLRDSNVRNQTLQDGKNALRDYAGPSQARITSYRVAEVVYSRNEAYTLNPQNRGQMTEALKSADDNGLVLLILDGKNQTAYANFKDLADRKYGIQSLCITRQTLSRSNVGEIMGNIMMKVNLKMAGSNHTIQAKGLHDCMRDTLILGADVTHPSAGSIAGCPSIAAIVGSVDSWAGRFLGSMRLQSQGRKEVCLRFCLRCNFANTCRSLMKCSRWLKSE